MFLYQQFSEEHVAYFKQWVEHDEELPDISLGLQHEYVRREIVIPAATGGILLFQDLRMLLVRRDDPWVKNFHKVSEDLGLICLIYMRKRVMIDMGERDMVHEPSHWDYMHLIWPQVDILLNVKTI